MSRAYRIKVRETLKRVLRASDGVSTQLELLEILPAEQMAELLARELEGRGYQRQGKKVSKKLEGNIQVSVDVDSGTVTVEAESCDQVELEESREGLGYAEQDNQKLKEHLRATVRKDLEKQADQKEQELQNELTDKLEQQLGNLRGELDQAVNRVTAEALKQKAAQLGQIKEMTEDQETGNLTIVLEV